MQLTFTYNKDKDIRCLLTKGKSSSNSQNATKQYQELVEKYGEHPTEEDVGLFIDGYITRNKIDIPKYIEIFQQNWESVSNEFQKRAESIFNTSLPADITAYLTTNSRCPYSIEDNFFYISLNPSQATLIAMHELWHFYTWYGLGTDQEEKLGKQKYNDLKESLTVLLNVECKDLLPEGVFDTGYLQHQKIRQNILEYWGKDRNIKKLWGYLAE